MRRHIWGYAVCPCPTKGTQGLYELKENCEKILCSGILIIIDTNKPTLAQRDAEAMPRQCYPQCKLYFPFGPLRSARVF